MVIVPAPAVIAVGPSVTGTGSARGVPSGASAHACAGTWPNKTSPKQVPAMLDRIRLTTKGGREEVRRRLVNILYE
jgi:hypothetical protein